MLDLQHHSSLIHLMTELSDHRHLISVRKHIKLAWKTRIANHIL